MTKQIKRRTLGRRKKQTKTEKKEGKMNPQKSVKSIRNVKYMGILFDKLSCVSKFLKDNYLNKTIAM